jgi:uncharacterized membrane protein
MRPFRDRLRHALAFEIIGLLLVAPLGALAFGHPLTRIGLVVLVSSLLAMVWTYVFNLGFDLALIRLTGRADKSLGLRILHALAFEGGLLLILMPFIAWYLGVSLLQALLIDLSFALVYVVYAFAYNWAYDRLFPPPA